MSGKLTQLRDNQALCEELRQRSLSFAVTAIRQKRASDTDVSRFVGTILAAVDRHLTATQPSASAGTKATTPAAVKVDPEEES